MTEGRRIAISLSGGGVRAMLFGLGALRAVVAATRGDDRISLVAGVSGGSIGAAYAFARCDPAAPSLSVDAFERNVLLPAFEAVTTRSMMWGAAPFWAVVSAMALLMAAALGLLLPRALLLPWWLPVAAGLLAGRAVWRYFSAGFGWRREAAYGLALVAAATAVTLLCGRVHASFAPRFAGVVALLLAMIAVARLRGWALEYGIGATLFPRRQGVLAPLLADVRSQAELAITATNLNAAEAIYLTPAGIVSDAFGTAPAGRLSLLRAARASGGFPGVFPALMLDGRGFVKQGTPNADALRRLALVDGGLYDNMGTERLIDSADCEAFLVVVDASQSLQRQSGGFDSFGLGELRVLAREQGVQYEESTAPRRRWLAAMFREAAHDRATNRDRRRGTIVRIDGSMRAWLRPFADSRLTDDVKCRAAAMLARLDAACPDAMAWSRLARANSMVPTSLDRLPAATARRLISTGYLATALQLQVLQGWPAPEAIDLETLLPDVFARPPAP